MNKKISIALVVAALSVTIAVAATTLATPVAAANYATCLVWYSTSGNEGTADVSSWPGTPSYAADARSVGCSGARSACYNAGYYSLWVDLSYVQNC